MPNCFLTSCKRFTCPIRLCYVAIATHSSYLKNWIGTFSVSLKTTCSQLQHECCNVTATHLHFIVSVWQGLGKENYLAWVKISRSVIYMMLLLYVSEWKELTVDYWFHTAHELPSPQWRCCTWLSWPSISDLLPTQTLPSLYHFPSLPPLKL